MAGYYTRGVGHHRNYGSLKPKIGQETLISRLHMAAEGAQVQQQKLEVKWRTCNLLQLFRLALHRRLEQRRVCHLSNRAGEAQHSHTNCVKPEHWHCTTEYPRVPPSLKAAPPKRPRLFRCNREAWHVGI